MSNDKNNSGVVRIAEERARQIIKKGWTAEHDDLHKRGELLIVAAEICVHPTDVTFADLVHFDSPDPWGILKRHGYDGVEPDKIHVLAIAGALIAAEIDRLLRIASPPVIAGGAGK